MVSDHSQPSSEGKNRSKVHNSASKQIACWAAYPRKRLYSCNMGHNRKCPIPRQHNHNHSEINEPYSSHNRPPTNSTNTSKQPWQDTKHKCHLSNKPLHKVRLEGFSPKFEILSMREGDLTIGPLNVRKIGKIKHTELTVTLSYLEMDCFAITEHHVEVSANDPDPPSVK